MFSFCFPLFKPIKFNLCWPNTLGYKACPGEWLSYQGSPLLRQLPETIKMLLSPQLWVGLHTPFSPLSAGVFSCLSTLRACASCHNPWEFICASVPLCLENTFCLSSTSGSYNLPSPSSEALGGGSGEMFHVGLSPLQSLIFCRF